MTPPSGPGRHGIALLLLAAAGAYWWASGHQGRELLADMAIMAILAMGLSLLAGHAGLASLAHAAFFGLGAYVFAELAAGSGWSPALAMPAAVAAGGLAALAVGLAVVRFAGMVFMLATLAAGEAAHVWLADDPSFGGAGGMSGVPRLDLSPAGIDTAAPGAFAPVAVAAAVLVYLLLDRLVLSPFGQTLRAIGQNEERARALGCATGRYKLAAFILAGAVAALAGTLAAQRAAAVTPALLDWTLSLEILAVVVVGGATSLLGVSAAAALWIGLRHQLPTLMDHWMLALAAGVFVLVLVAGEGIDGALRSLWRRLALRRSA
jgi:branched-chain amino acid transport system permease protein